ncbi:MAG: tetratricopeptide repeat protein [Oscillospiraceae bacterium]
MPHITAGSAYTDGGVFMRGPGDPDYGRMAAELAVSIPIVIAAGMLFYRETGSVDIIYIAVVYIVFILPLIFRSVSEAKKKDEPLFGKTFRGLDFASFKFRKAESLHSEGHFSDAIHTYKEVEEYRLTPRETAVLYFYMGMCYRDMGYPTNAAASFERSDEVYFLRPGVLLNAERSYVDAGNFYKAEEISDRMFERKYDENYFRFLWSDRGRIFLRANVPDRAIDAFEKGLDAGLDLCGAYCGLAVAHLMKRDVPKSRSYVEKAAASGGMSGQEGFYVYYGEVARSLGLFEEVRDMIMHDDEDEEDQD